MKGDQSNEMYQLLGGGVGVGTMDDSRRPLKIQLLPRSNIKEERNEKNKTKTDGRTDNNKSGKVRIDAHLLDTITTTNSGGRPNSEKVKTGCTQSASRY